MIIQESAYEKKIKDMLNSKNQEKIGKGIAPEQVKKEMVINKIPTPMFEPYSDRLVVRKVDIDFKSAGGIYLGEIEKDAETMYGRVVAVGDGKQVDGTGLIPMKTKVGDLLVIKANLPTKVNVKGLEYYVLRESDVFFRLNDADAVEREFVSEGKEYDIQGARILR